MMESLEYRIKGGDVILPLFFLFTPTTLREFLLEEICTERLKTKNY